MPTNMPPEYFDAEKRYKQAQTVQEKIERLTELLGTIPKHKGTDKIRADYRRRLSKLRSQAQQKKGAVRHDSAFVIDKEGAGQVAIVGPPNVGKSTLLTRLTHATPDIADFPMTTWTPTPGMMKYEDIQIQLIDTPPLTSEHIEHELYDLIKRVDLVLLMLSLHKDPGGQLDECLDLLKNKRIYPQHLKDSLIETKGFKFLPFHLVVNKYDGQEEDEEFDIFCEFLPQPWPLLPISAQTCRNLDQLKEIVFHKLDIIRIYSKVPGKPPALDSPFVLEKGSTVEEFAQNVHHDFVDNLKMVRMWGEGVFDGQNVPRNHILHDKDIVELHI
ncbi:MAG: hypothetical protein APR63_08625 [Desulfuromonas sp. SDB]|nr:MAG: hypothetical protein APR63_08625 [Desulfuromonas sp. SDB]